MEIVSIKNGHLFGPFTNSFGNLTKVKTLPAADKFELVKLRKKMIEVAENIKEAIDDTADKEQARDLLDASSDYEFNRIDPKLVVDSLSADDLFHLEPLFKE